MGASSKNTFSFSRISVRFSHKWRSAATESAIECPTARAGCLVALRAKSVALRSSFHSLWSQTSPLVHLFKNVRLVGLKDGHRVEGHACLTGRDVGLSDKGGSGFLRSGLEFGPLRNRSSSFEARDSRGSSGQSSTSFSVVRESTSTSSEWRWRLRLLAARRERIR